MRITVEPKGPVESTPRTESQGVSSEIMESEDEKSAMGKYLSMFVEQGIIRKPITKAECELTWRDSELEAALATFSDYAKEKKAALVIDHEYTAVAYWAFYEFQIDNDHAVGTLLWCIDKGATNALLELEDDSYWRVMQGCPEAAKSYEPLEDFLAKVKARAIKA